MNCTAPWSPPFTIIVDTREQAPFRFEGLLTDKKLGSRPIAANIECTCLKTGDYAIKGMEDRAAVERKSLEDLFSTLGSRRRHFEAEHERLAALESAAVVIEADWNTILLHSPRWSHLNPKTVFRTAISWQHKYHVPWITMGSRRGAEAYTFRFLEKFWEHRQKVVAQVAQQDDGGQQQWS